MFDTSLSCFKKDQTIETVLRKECQQLRERYNSYFEAYTDGSKCEQKVAAAEDPDDPGTVRFRDGSSIFNGVLEGIFLVLRKFLILTKTKKNFIICTDSFSAVESLQGKMFRTKNIRPFYNLPKKWPPEVQVVIAWIP